MTKTHEQPPRQLLVIGRSIASEDTESNALAKATALFSKQPQRRPLGVLAINAEYDFSQPVNEANSNGKQIASSMLGAVIGQRFEIGNNNTQIILENRLQTLHGIFLGMAHNNLVNTREKSEIHVVTHEKHWPHVQQAGSLVLPEVILTHVNPAMPLTAVNRSRDMLDDAVANMYKQAIPDSLAGDLNRIEEADEQLKIDFPYMIANMYPEGGITQFARKYGQED